MKLFCRFLTVSALSLYAAAVLMSCAGEDAGSASETPTTFTAAGGFLEQTPGNLRPRWNAAELRTFLPTSRGKFYFPPPYNTEAIRITDASD